MYHYTFFTQKTTAKLLRDLVEAFMNEEFKLLWQFELHQRLEEKGFFPKRKQTILEVCNPDEASSILGFNPLVAYFLPCKILITEEAGYTSIGFLRPTKLIKLTKDQRAIEKAKEIEDRLIAALKRAV